MKRFGMMFGLTVLLALQAAASTFGDWRTYCGSPMYRGATLSNPAFPTVGNERLTEEGERRFRAYAKSAKVEAWFEKADLAPEYRQIFRRAIEECDQIVTVTGVVDPDSFERIACRKENDSYWHKTGGAETDFQYMLVQGCMPRGALQKKLGFGAEPECLPNRVQDFGDACVAGVLVKRLCERKGIFINFYSRCGNGGIRIFTVVPIVVERERVVERRVEVPSPERIVEKEVVVEKPVYRDRIVREEVVKEVKVERTCFVGNPLEELPLNRGMDVARIRATPGFGAIAVRLLEAVASAPRTSISVGGATAIAKGGKGGTAISNSQANASAVNNNRVNVHTVNQNQNNNALSNTQGQGQSQGGR